MSQQISYRIGNRLYLSITNRCTLACAFCPKTQGICRVHDYDLTMMQRPDSAAIIAAIDDPAIYEEVVFCGYGEPTLRLNVLLAVARHVKERGGRVRVNTDGLANLVHKRDVLPILGKWVDAVSISLNAQNAEVYAIHCHPALPESYVAMRYFLRRAPQFIPEVTATAIAGLAGVDISACARIAQECGVQFRRRELNQVG